jgi:hypothetical protein
VRNSISFKNAAHGFTDNGNPGVLALSRGTAFGNQGTGFDADVPASKAVLAANLSLADGRAVALASTVTSSGNSWDLGGTWNASSVLSTDSSAITGARGSDGSLPSGPNFLVPRDGTEIGARF